MLGGRGEGFAVGFLFSFFSFTNLVSSLMHLQTDATSHNIICPTMLEVVGIGCEVHANERNNCQHCWRLSKEAMYSDTLILKEKTAVRMHRRFHNVFCATLHRSHNNRNVGTCCAKSLTGFKLYAASANKCQHCCGSMQTDVTC